MDGESERMRRVIESGAEVARLVMRGGVSAEEWQNAVAVLAGAFVEWAIPAIRRLLDAIGKSVRRDWPRPQNQRVRPLLMDRRRKTYHCRNAI